MISRKNSKIDLEIKICFKIFREIKCQLIETYLISRNFLKYFFPGGGIDGEQSDQDDNESLLIIKGHEQRILNFLINEYLLQYGFKLTSITFSDENNDADYFEDWDNIGINVTKPPNLLKLYRDYGKHFMNQENEQKTGEKYQDVEIMTEEDSRLIELQEKSSKQNQQLSDLETKLNDLNIQFHQQVSTNQQISMQLKEKESVIEILRNHPVQIEDIDTSKSYGDLETGDQGKNHALKKCDQFILHTS